jgi:hypothetical protein
LLSGGGRRNLDRPGDGFGEYLGQATHGRTGLELAG